MKAGKRYPNAWPGARKYPEVNVGRQLHCGQPARWIVEESQRAQLVVVGSHGRGGPSGMLLGSVSSAGTQRLGYRLSSPAARDSQVAQPFSTMSFGAAAVSDRDARHECRLGSVYEYLECNVFPTSW